MTTPEYRQRVFESVTAGLADKFPRDDSSLPWALATCQQLRQDGHDAVLRAGSAFWYSGERWFGYRWDPSNPWSPVLEQMGFTLEMHVWVEVIDLAITIDLTTGSWPTRAALRGTRWTAPPPPEFLWDSTTTVRDYKVARAAIVAALKYARRLAKLYPRRFKRSVEEQFSRLVS